MKFILFLTSRTQNVWFVTNFIHFRVYWEENGKFIPDRKKNLSLSWYFYCYSRKFLKGVFEKFQFKAAIWFQSLGIMSIISLYILSWLSHLKRKSYQNQRLIWCGDLKRWVDREILLCKLLLVKFRQTLIQQSTKTIFTV